MDEQTKTALMIAGLAALIAFWGVVTQRILARRLATVEHIFNLLNDHDFIKARTKFISIAKSENGLLPFAEEDCDDTESEAAIDLVLNNYELIAIGIQRGILDYVIMRRYVRAIVLRHWDVSAAYITQLRIVSGNAGYYSEFETLKKWMSDDKSKPNGRILSLFF